MTISRVGALVLAGAAALSFAVACGSNSHTIALQSMMMMDSGMQTGTATITEGSNGQLTVDITVSPPQTAPQPAHIHQPGQCGGNALPVYTLNSVDTMGKSSTVITVDGGYAALKGNSYINVHDSAAPNNPVACGNIQ